MDQLLREWPPGFGGVERVAHTLAAELGGRVFALARPAHPPLEDPLAVGYRRRWLVSLPLGRVRCPLPSLALVQLLLSPQPLLAHLPCPTVLMVAVLARLLRPRRPIRFVWHAFLAPRPGPMGWLEGVYQRLALVLLRWFPVITTSPVLEEALRQAGLPPRRLHVLPCALPESAEQAFTALWCERQQPSQAPVSTSPAERPQGVLIAIGRLDSYKRFDWLIEAMAEAPAVAALHLLGDGPDRPRLEALARDRLPAGQIVHFHGRGNESCKLKLLAAADLLVLPADRCNEAFGIVQLEAMACGIPAIAFQLPRSGMHWVGALPALSWSGEPRQLPGLLERVLTDPTLYRLACQQARERYEQQFSRQVWRRQLLGLGLSGA